VILVDEPPPQGGSITVAKVGVDSDDCLVKECIREQMGAGGIVGGAAGGMSRCSYV
jgi:hypothetical protein